MTNMKRETMEQAKLGTGVRSCKSEQSDGSVSDYLQTFAEVLRVGHESGVFISFIEPGTAADFCWSLLPVHSVALPLHDMYIISLSIHSNHHLRLRLSYCTVNTHTYTSRVYKAISPFPACHPLTHSLPCPFCLSPAVTI